MSKAIEASKHSLIEVEGAVQMQQNVQVISNGDARCITTTWLRADASVARQDQCVVVDRMPAIGGAV